MHDGVALAIKRQLKHHIIDNQEFFAVEIETTRGPINLATAYLPPRRPFLPYPDILRLLREQKPVYIMGDLNARHATLGRENNNNIGNSIAQLMSHLGPDFPTLIRNNTATSPDIVMSNRYGYPNIHITPRDITTSDHLPIIMEISTDPLSIPITPRADYKNANWDQFKQILGICLY